MKKIILLFFVLLALSGLITAQSTYSPVDKASRIHFVIKNFGFNTGGDFSGLKGTIKFDPVNYTSTYFDVSIDANSINTDNNKRDNHLRQAEYFDAEKYKTIVFKSTKVVLSTVTGRFYVFGNLTIRGVTKPVEFGFSATAKDGGFIFKGEFEINRRDFGVGGSSITMSDNLKLSLSVFAK